MGKKGYSFKAALFDLDGVVFDTEPQYSVFWRQEGLRYHPEIEGLELKIKGQTLVQIFDRFFADMKDEQPKIMERLNEYERNMKYEFIDGFNEFISDLRSHGVHTAVVTSSNLDKMSNVYRQHPDFKLIFDAILTSEDFAESKPSPDCYLKGAARFGLQPNECVVFEDSFNGLKSGRTSGAFVVGLSTTNKADEIAAFADSVIADYRGVSYDDIVQKINQL